MYDYRDMDEAELADLQQQLKKCKQKLKKNKQKLREAREVIAKLLKHDLW